MNELERLDLIKQGNSLLEGGFITEEDFESFKKVTLSESAVTPSLSFDDLKKIKKKLDDDLITEEDYSAIKKNVFAGKKVADIEVFDCLDGIKKYIPDGIIDDKDYEVLKSNVLSSSDAGYAKALVSQMDHLKEYYSFCDLGIIDEEDCSKYKESILKKKMIMPMEMESVDLLKKYKELLDKEIISADDYKIIKDRVLAHKVNKWMNETEALTNLKAAYDKSLINADEFDRIKKRFFSGKAIQKKDVFDSLAKYKALADKGIIDNAEYNLFKNNILNSKPVKPAEEVETLSEYKDLLDQGVIKQEDYDKYKKGVIPVEGADSQESADKNKKKRNIIIIACICAAAVLAGIAYLSTLPEKKAKAEVAEYIEAYDQKLSSGDYVSLSNESLALQEKDKEYLSEEEMNELIIRSNYALGLEEIDLRNSIPSEQPDYYRAIEAFDNTNNYGISKSLGAFVSEYQDSMGSLEGTVVVPPQNDATVSVIDNPADSILTTTSTTGRHVSGSSSGSASYNGITGSGQRAQSSDDTEKEEEKSKEYSCTGKVYLGFDKVVQNGDISKENVKNVFALKLEVDSEAKEVEHKTFEGIINEEDKDDFVLTGVNSDATVKGSFDGSTWTFDFGNGIKATLKRPVYNSSSSSSNSGSSSSKKDYSAGSEWEKYDKDKDGRINDNEFQDATNDYMDNYFNNNSGGSDYSAGSDWENYDSNSDGRINDSEFQNAVGDYMDKYGY